MHNLRALGFLLCLVLAPQWTAALAQTAAPPAAEAGRALAGTWELSNAERDRTCTVTLETAASGPGLALQWSPKCVEAFPFTAGAVAWRVGARDALHFLDKSGASLVALAEMEGGLYEGRQPGRGLLFMQSMASRSAEEKAPAQLAGDWQFTSGNGDMLCRIALTENPTTQATLALTVQSGCDEAIARFAPAAWQIDRGQLLIISSRGETWRFEEVDAITWRRIPAGRQPLQLTRQQDVR